MTRNTLACECELVVDGNVMLAGSVILAGVLLKLGGYGFIRFSWPLLPEASKFFAPLIQTYVLMQSPGVYGWRWRYHTVVVFVG